MSRYFLDTEFLEGSQKTFFGKTKPTINLISIGIVDENGREFYAISKEFNLKEAWNRYDLNHGSGDQRNYPPRKVYWIRENVLKPIYDELLEKEVNLIFKAMRFSTCYKTPYKPDFCYKTFKYLINRHGKLNKEIALQIKSFVNGIGEDISVGYGDKKFYGYFADYDYVCLAWLFGRMKDYPTGFPQYIKDIQQVIDDNEIDKDLLLQEVPQYNSHNALSDAIWNKKAYEWIVKRK